jgi:hypothetical protein
LSSDVFVSRSADVDSTAKATGSVDDQPADNRGKGLSGASAKGFAKGKGPPLPNQGKGIGKGAAPIPPRKGTGSKGKGATCGKATRGVSGGGQEKAPDEKVSTHTKKLFWNSFRIGENCDGSTVWTAIQSSGLDVNTDELDELFAEHSSPPKGTQLGAGNRAVSLSALIAPETVQVNNKIQVLESQRRQEVDLMLARIPGRAEGMHQACDAVSCMDLEFLDRDKVDLLLLNTSPPEERVLLRKAEKESLAETRTWGTAEQFLLLAMKVPGFNLKLDIMNFEYNFHERLNPISEAAAGLMAGCEAVLSSAGVQHILGLILHIGNHLNRGTDRGEADGFSLEVLAQMRSLKLCKGSDEGTTMVDYLVKQMEHRFPDELEDMFRPSAEVEQIKVASRVKLRELVEDLNTVQAKLGMLRRKIHDEIKPQADDVVDQKLIQHSEILAMCQAEVDAVRQRLREVERRYDTLCAWFHMDSASIKKTTDQFFGIWTKFMADVQQARMLRVKAEQQKRREQRQASHKWLPRVVSMPLPPDECKQDGQCESRP